jgi:sugar phosphate isomerase/epimerase
MRDNLYVSSIVFDNKSLNEIIQICKKSNYNLEFSSNIPFQKKNIDLFASFIKKKLIHNYFPAPKIPFVLNLASSNKIILKKSIDHCKQNILLSSKFDLPFYAAHAGFCLDPMISSLGKKIRSRGKINRRLHLEIFMKSLSELLNFSNIHEVNFCIENNVLSKENYELNNEQNIFLCTDYKEIKMILDEFKLNKLGLLLDTGHLKVSSNTLNLDLNIQTSKILNYVKAIHHSDNNGLQDLNLPFDKDYWFIPYLKKFDRISHVIEVKNINPKTINNQIKILENEL